MKDKKEIERFNRVKELFEKQRAIMPQTPDALDVLKPEEDNVSTSHSIAVMKEGLVPKNQEVSSADFLNALAIDESKYTDMIVSPSDMKDIQAYFRKAAVGVISAVPMLCTGPSCAFSSTCLPGSSLITMAAGNDKPIKDIVLGQTVLAYDQSTDQMTTGLVCNRVRHHKRDVYAIKTDSNHEIICTDDHPIYSLLMEDIQQGFNFHSLVDGLNIGDMIAIYHKDNWPVEEEHLIRYGHHEHLFMSRIASISHHGNEEVYDITIETAGTFFANSVLVHNCPYAQINKAPVGRECPVEVQLIHYYASQYMTEFEADPKRPTEMRLIMELAEIDIFEIRATKLLAEKYPTLLQNVVHGIDSQGNVVESEDIAKIFNLKEKLKKSRLTILDTLMATRKDRAKVMIDALNATSSRADIGSIHEKLSAIKRDVKNNTRVQKDNIRQKIRDDNTRLVPSKEKPVEILHDLDILDDY